MDRGGSLANSDYNFAEPSTQRLNRLHCTVFHPMASTSSAELGSAAPRLRSRQLYPAWRQPSTSNQPLSCVPANATQVHHLVRSTQ